MRLKRLVCRGFKSFADRTEFDFDNSLTGIIGPNGCGKSNVVDALKWVLGDQRAKSLRGSEMTDVIFKGAEGRDAMGLADVRVVLEDPEGSFDGHVEVEIGRQLTRDKESSYLLNGQSVRLKDVRDVLLDTGLGVGGYSVMEQGRIDAVLSANPESRRAIFEEAAGISKFKLQKKESLRRLERTEQNLARVQDLLEERARRIRSLKIQAGKARRYKELKSRLRDLRAALAVLEARELRVRLESMESELAERHAAVAEAAEQRAAAAAAVAEAEQAIAACSAEVETAQEQVHTLGGSFQASSQRAESQVARAAELEEDATSCDRRFGVLGEQREERARATEIARTALESREAELVGLGGQLEERSARLASLQDELRTLQKQREELRGRLLEHIHTRTRQKNHAHDHEAQLRALAGRVQRVAERTALLTGQRAEVDAEHAEVAAVAADVAQRARILAEREARALGDLDQADAAAAELARAGAELQKSVSEVEGRLGGLEAMEAHMEGLDQGPKHLLETRPEGLKGRLLDLLEIDLEYSTALEAALGPYVQALVVDTRAHAEAIVADLQASERGRVLILVEEEFGSDLERGPDLPLPEGAQFLAQLVRCTPRILEEGEDENQFLGVRSSRRLLNWLLRGVVLVDDLTQAVPSRADLCFVTRDGALRCGPRLEGGAGERHSGLIQRRSQIQALRQQSAELEAEFAAVGADSDAAQGRVERLRTEVRELGVALKKARAEEQRAEGELQRLSRRRQDLADESEELGIEEREVSTHRVRALAALGTHLCNGVLVQRMEERDAAREADLAEELEISQRRVDEVAHGVQEMRLQQVSAQSERDSQRDAIRMHEEALRDLERAADDLAERRQQAREGAERARKVAEEERLAAGGLQEQLTEAQGRRDELSMRLDEVRQRREEAQEALREHEARHGEASEAVTELRLQLSDFEHRFTRLEERLRDDTGVALRRCLGEVKGLGLVGADRFAGPVAPIGSVAFLEGPPLPPAWVDEAMALSRLWDEPEFDRSDAEKEVKVLRSSLDRLGAVNPDAVEELAQEEESFVQVEQEVEDLREARRSLMETLRRLEEESRGLFIETFNEARDNFQTIFRKLFQGGKADMFLVDEADALESGIQIMARPPGKQLQSINLLSGGERSMTALAILFAVFKVKPSPFCILDEVDAALDETNVERFLRVLRDFVGETQFCIVTHHKRTMAECQVLYGITMQKRGVSSRIAVSLDEVDSIGDSASAQEASDAQRAKKQRIAGEEALGF